MDSSGITPTTIMNGAKPTGGSSPGSGSDRCFAADPLDRSYDAITDLFVGEIGADGRPPSVRGPAEDGRSIAAIVGLVPLEARCPFAPAVELALDDAGTIQLLAHAEPDEDACLRSLLIAASWLRDHRELVALTARPRSTGADQPPIMHIIACRPDAVPGLLRTGCLVHLELPGGGAVKLG